MNCTWKLIMFLYRHLKLQSLCPALLYIPYSIKCLDKTLKDEFICETITSKYFTPSQFLESKLSANKFSMLHINIASLSKHIDELRSLIKVLDYPFGIIGITETLLYEDTHLVNIEIGGYVFKHTATKTRCGGA